MFYKIESFKSLTYINGLFDMEFIGIVRWICPVMNYIIMALLYKC
jgi:hypothetical protein